jgi:hypothetical protein
MGGGLMNLIASSSSNPILNGNPTKTFFKTTYSKYTNFGMQKFRIDYDGLRTLRLCEESKFTFKIPRYADLLMDTYLVISLPNIWSPIYPPETAEDEWRPYEFKWIEDIGNMIIQNITIRVGGQVLQQFSGNYLHSIVSRDYPIEKKNKYNNMTGNINHLNDPGTTFSNVNTYPNAYFLGEGVGALPSIRENKLYIPLNPWFMLSNKFAFPLIALQYNSLHIDVTLRSINDLFKIRDVKDKENQYPYVRPNFNDEHMAMYRFLHAPPSEKIAQEDYNDLRSIWNADIHLMSTYAFISDEESRLFASNEHKYLFKQIYEYKFDNVTGSKKVQVNTNHLVSSWSFYFQRSDVKQRNEWNNYTNWPYNNQPPGVLFNAPIDGNYKYTNYALNKSTLELSQPNGFGAGVNPNTESTPWMITGPYNPIAEINILKDFGILFDGNYREDKFSYQTYQYIEKYAHSSGGDETGLYCYNFCLNTNVFDTHPSGAVDMSKFQKIEVEFTTLLPPLDENAQTLTICDDNGDIIGVNKPTWNIFEYNYDLTIIEERYNILYFLGGNCGLVYAN